MAFYPGSSYDRQSRVAQSSQNYDQVHGTPNVLQGKDALPSGQSTLDTRRPQAYLSRTQRSVAQIAGQFDQVQATPRPLVGKDALPPGQATLDTRRPPAYLTRQRIAAIQSQNYDQVHATPLALMGKDQMAPGQSTLDTRRPTAFLARQFRYPVYDANSGNAFLPEQVVVTLPVGQSTGRSEIPPRARPRSAESYVQRPPIVLTALRTSSVTGSAAVAGTSTGTRTILSFGNEGSAAVAGTSTATLGSSVVVAGDQSTELPAAHYARRRALDYTHTDRFKLTLIGQDAMVAGDQLSGNAPAAARRAADYTHTQDLIPNLVGQDAMLVGQQSYVLPPIAPLRARDYTFAPPINLCTLTTVVQPLPYGMQVTDALPPRPAARARDYSLAEAFPLTLIGQDAMTAGAQSTALSPIGALRARDYSFVPPVNLCCLTTVQQPIPPGQQATDVLPPKAAQRARDYTHIDQTRRQLIGQDAMPTGQNADRSALPPKAAARSRDYTWLQTYPLYIYEQLPPGESTAVTEGPPRGPLRLRDYTHLDLTKLNLAGQDAMTVGQQWLDTDNLPPRAPARMVDYTWFQRLNISEVLLLTHPGHHEVTDSATFIHSLTDRAKILHTLSATG